MNQAEYLRQISNNPTAYGAGQPFAANAYFGQGIANTVDQAVAGVARSLGISPQAAAPFTGIFGPHDDPEYDAFIRGMNTPQNTVVSDNPVTKSLLDFLNPLTSAVTGTGGWSTGGTTVQKTSGGTSGTTGTDWASILTTIALPIIVVGLVLYLIWTGLTEGPKRSVA
jgi:hypothetical protein